MIISWSDNGTRSYSYELSRASRWEKQAGCAGAQRNADFMLEKSGNGAGKEELRSRRRLSDNAKKLPKERERNEEKEATRWRRMRDGKWERMRRWKVYGSERGKVKFCEKKEDAWWYGSCRTRNVVNRGRRNGSSGGTLYLLLALCVTRSLFIFWEWRGTVWHVAGRKDVRGTKGGYVSVPFGSLWIPSPASLRKTGRFASIEAAESRSQAAAARTYKCHIIIPDNERSWSGGGLSSFLRCASRAIYRVSVHSFIHSSVWGQGNACLDEERRVCGYRARKARSPSRWMTSACFRTNDLSESRVSVT